MGMLPDAVTEKRAVLQQSSGSGNPPARLLRYSTASVDGSSSNHTTEFKTS
ncbi:hypothetical protein H1P_230058 [Hyella patelloides LEGE 07179]|uniref:Uncharacterized protein n=1 Tax=Hyella patelloides LEGE 07179 TaxID=945734 RepID=A0A563VRF0_9CYAN|nr:hypothetical protein H1P_230058 [Hyella patelloides LEGE 07179]